MQIYNFVEGERQFYENRHIPLIAGDDYSQYQLIRAINFTRRNKYIDDNATDDIIGDFPYDNISKYRIRLEARSTDFDLKHIENTPKDSSRRARISSMVASKCLQEELKEIKFDRFLNKYADTRPEYGSVLIKRVGEEVHVVPWENVITDMADILNNPIIEKHYYSPAQLRDTGWDDELVTQAIITANQKKKDKDVKRSADDEAETVGRFIEVIEVTGELSVAMLKEANEEEWDAEDESTFTLCRIIYAQMGKDKDSKLQGIVFVADELSKNEYPYKLDVRHPVVGRQGGLGEGIPEELAEHQRWHNFYKTEEARAVAIGGKVLFITDDGSVVDSIYADGIEHGTILQKTEGSDFRQLTTMPNSVPVYQNIRAEWADSADKNTSSFDAVLGEESKSGTPFRAQYLQNVTGTSQFEREREDMGMFIKEIIEDWLLPQALKKAAKKENIYTYFTRQELALIDEVIVEQMVLDYEVDVLLNEKRPVTPEEVEQQRMNAQRELQKMGNRRTIEDIKEFIKEAGEYVTIHTTDEQRSKAVLFESYSNALQLFGENDPARMALRDRILDQMGITQEELALYAGEAMQAAQQLGQPQQATPNARIDTEQLQQEESLAAAV